MNVSKMLEAAKKENRRISLEYNYKKGISDSLEEIKRIQRWDLEWEWMSESKSGQFVKIEDVKKCLIRLLKSDDTGGLK